jgi:tetratricopeptide (TPR) repeat protein
LRQYDKALADCSRAVELDPKLSDAWSGRGIAYIELGQPEKAIADLSRAIELDPTFAEFWSNRGYACNRLGQYDRAVADCSRAIELDPKFAKAWLNRGAAYGHLGESDKAVADYSRAIELNSKNAVVWSHRGDTYRTLKQYDKAVADYSRAIELNPQNGLIYNELAWLLADCTEAKVRNPARAVEAAKKAVELAPNVGDYWNTLGVAHYRAGEAKEAIAALKKSTELRRGGDAFDWFFLAMAHRKLGNADEARKWYDQAVEWQEKNKETLAKDKPHAEELRRFRAEAEEVLELKKQ